MFKLPSLKFIAVQLLYLVTFGLASLRKWEAGGVQESFRDQFGESWLAELPGELALPYYTIVILESLIVVLFIISLFRMEWQSNSDKRFMLYGLIVSLFTFVVLAYGLMLTGQFQGTANAFFYFGCTLFALYITEKASSASVHKSEEELIEN